MADAFQYDENIYVLEDPVAYRKEVVNYLDLINTTYVGQILFKYIKRMGSKKLLILPYVPAKEKSPVNAYAQADKGRSAYGKNQPMMTAIKIPGYGTIMLPTATFGTGAGSSVHLKYHPAMYRQVIANKHRMDPGDGPGEVLFHEMLHAQRMMNGKFIQTTVTEDLGMDDFEEFCAILAQNMYRSERGFKDLRKNHHGHEKLDDKLSDPAAYASHFEAEIKKWFESQEHFCVEMATSQAAFNPLKYVALDLGIDVPTPMAVGP